MSTEYSLGGEKKEREKKITQLQQTKGKAHMDHADM